MNSIKNSVTLMGHLGADPEVKKLDNGNTLTKFRLATNETFRNRDGHKVTNTHWHTCIAWGKQAELMGQYLKKGKEVILRGKLTYNSYSDKDGNTREVPEIVVNDFSLTGKKEG